MNSNSVCPDCGGFGSLQDVKGLMKLLMSGETLSTAELVSLQKYGETDGTDVCMCPVVKPALLNWLNLNQLKAILILD